MENGGEGGGEGKGGTEGERKGDENITLATQLTNLSSVRPWNFERMCSNLSICCSNVYIEIIYESCGSYDDNDG